MPSIVNGNMEKGKSPYAKFYLDRKSNERFAVISRLPMVDADSAPIEAGWEAIGEGFEAKNNLFTARVVSLEITLSVRNDQPDGRKAGHKVTYCPRLFLNGAERKPVSGNATLLDIDPDNSHYPGNTLEWDYGICKRRLRIIEGAILGFWLFDKNPGGEVKIVYNQKGDFKLKLGQYAVIDDEELIPAKAFDNPRFDYPSTVADSSTFYAGSADCDIYNNGSVYSTVRNAGTGTAIEGGSSSPYAIDVQNYYYAGGTTYYVGRMFLPFDTSSLPDSATISAVTVAVYGYSGGQADAGHSSLKVYKGTQADSPTTVDYDSFETTEFSDDFSPWAYPLSTSGYSTITLNAAGRAAISLTGTTKFCIRCTGDINNLTPTGLNYVHVYSNEKGSGYQSKLVVTYTSGETKTSGDSASGTEAISLRELGMTDAGSAIEGSLTTAAVITSDGGTGSEIGGPMKSFYSSDEGSGADGLKMISGKAGADMKLRSQPGQVGLPHKEVHL
jgi:hypothetical protein